ncbi:MAG: DNA polymerase III subunit delta [Kiritimatiellae bacterium]|nr:DNA polymerase III subunit delta [Kiritimatiellia bacterium]
MSGRRDGRAAGAGPSVVLLFGDGYRVEQAARRWMAAWCPPDSRIWAAEEVSLESDAEDQIVSALRAVLLALETAPMFGEGKAVWFRAGSALQSARLGRGGAQPWLQKLVTRIRGGLPAGHRLLITGSGIDRRSALFRAVHECGEVGDYALSEKAWERERELRRLVEEVAAQKGIRMEPEAVELFLDRIGADGHIVHGEIEKLALYLGERRSATAADVREITSVTREVEGWDLADWVGARRPAAAFAALRRLLDQRAEPIQLIGGLEGRLRELTILRMALDRGWLRRTDRSVVWTDSPEANATLAALGEWDPRQMHSFRLGRLVEQAENFSAAELASAGEAVTRARERMVGGFPSPELLLELLVLRISRPPRR